MAGVSALVPLQVMIAVSRSRRLVAMAFAVSLIAIGIFAWFTTVGCG